MNTIIGPPVNLAITASPPVQIATVEVGKQPSGMAINRAGTLALVANRADDTVSVLSIDGKNVKPARTVSVATQPTAAVAAPPPHDHAILRGCRRDAEDQSRGGD